LTGYYIDDIEGGVAPKLIPFNTTIEPFGYYVMSFSNALNNDGDEVRFLSASMEVLDNKTYSSSTPGYSRYVNDIKYICNEDLIGNIITGLDILMEDLGLIGKVHIQL
jgi:hypothetical protein